MSLKIFLKIPWLDWGNKRGKERKGNPYRFLFNGVPSYLYEVRLQPQEREFITAEGDYHIPYKHDCTVPQHEITSLVLGERVYFHLHTIQFFLSFPNNSVEGSFWAACISLAPGSCTWTEHLQETVLFSKPWSSIDYRITKLCNWKTWTAFLQTNAHWIH